MTGELLILYGARHAFRAFDTIVLTIGTLVVAAHLNTGLDYAHRAPDYICGEPLQQSRSHPGQDQHAFTA